MHEPVENHDGQGMNVLFADGHVEFVLAGQAQAVLDRAARGATTKRMTNDE